eukprot:scaffold1291_cov412-Prasinococcus_capsulatus_cf.AAC.17
MAPTTSCPGRCCVRRAAVAGSDSVLRQPRAGGGQRKGGSARAHLGGALPLVRPLRGVVEVERARDPALVDDRVQVEDRVLRRAPLLHRDNLRLAPLPASAAHTPPPKGPSLSSRRSTAFPPSQPARASRGAPLSAQGLSVPGDSHAAAI